MKNYLFVALLLVVVSGCQSPAQTSERVTQEMNVAWLGHSKAEVLTKKGKPQINIPTPDGGESWTWIYTDTFSVLGQPTTTTTTRTIVFDAHGVVVSTSHG